MELAIHIDLTSSTSLQRQIYVQVRDRILSGDLKPGQRLPSSRWLAESLGVSRTTISVTYDQLLSEGYIRSSIGAGTFVNDRIPDELPLSGQLGLAAQHKVVGEGPFGFGSYENLLVQSSYRRFVRPQKTTPTGVSHIEFKQGRPALTALPNALRKRLFADTSDDVTLLDYADDAAGHLSLRKEIAAYLIRSRGVRCTHENILVTNGTQQALELCARLFIEPGAAVVVEDPGYLSARFIFQSAGANLIGVPVDESGLNTSVLASRLADKCVKLAYVTPSHQFPTGVVMSLPRRLELLSLAAENNMLIFEDDYDSEFRYTGAPIPALQGLDSAGSVIYGGTFSKVLFPALRIGYLVLSTSLMPLFSGARWIMDRQSNLSYQSALAEIIADGKFEQHIRRMRTYYNKLRARLIQRLQMRFKKRLVVLGDSAGVHVMIRVQTKYSLDELTFRFQQLGVGIEASSHYYLEGDALTMKGCEGMVELLLGYGSLTEAQIDEGVQRLGAACLK